MASQEIDGQVSAFGYWFPRIVAIIGGIAFLAFGIWAMAGSRSFFNTLATFEPYNQHFIQDIGAFQVGLGAVLLLAGLLRRGDGLAIALLGVGAGAALHAVSHFIGSDLGGNPQTDIPFFTIMAVLLLAAGLLRWRQATG